MAKRDELALVVDLFDRGRDHRQQPDRKEG